MEKLNKRCFLVTVLQSIVNWVFIYQHMDIVHFLPCVVCLCLDLEGVLLHPRHFAFESDLSVSLIKHKYRLLPDYIWIELYILVVKLQLELWARDDLKCFCI